jgi:hypothetical protein
VTDATGAFPIVTNAVSASVRRVAMTMNVPDVKPAVNNPLGVTVPPVAE